MKDSSLTTCLLPFYGSFYSHSTDHSAAISAYKYFSRNLSLEVVATWFRTLCHDLIQWIAQPFKSPIAILIQQLDLIPWFQHLNNLQQPPLSVFLGSKPGWSAYIFETFCWMLMHRHCHLAQWCTRVHVSSVYSMIDPKQSCLSNWVRHHYVTAMDATSITYSDRNCEGRNEAAVSRSKHRAKKFESDSDAMHGPSDRQTHL